MELFDIIKTQLDRAEASNEKTATFHYLVLKHADVLGQVDKYQFCEAVGMKESFVAEFSKMINVSKIMKQRSVILALPL